MHRQGRWSADQRPSLFLLRAAGFCKFTASCVPVSGTIVPMMMHNRQCARLCPRRQCILLLATLAAALFIALQPCAARAQTPVPSDNTFLPLQPLVAPQPSIYLPLISGSDNIAPTPVRSAQPVYGLLGTLEKATRFRDTERLRLPNGATYVLVPATERLDSEIGALAASSSPTGRVWGTLYAANTSASSVDTNAYIIVSAIVAADEIPVASGPPTPTPLPLTAVARFSVVNLYSGPGSNWPRGGQFTAGMRCPIAGRNANATWIRIDCAASGNSGWIEPRFVNVVGQISDAPVVQGAERAPTPTPTPTPTTVPTAQPYTFRGWRTLYFTNAQLRGAPAFVDDVAQVGGNWGAGSPRQGMPADYFSIAYERTVVFPSGFYFFTAEADDGLRFLLDGVTLLDQWSMPGAQSLRLGIALSGAHDLRIEYNEVSGTARLAFAWQAATQTVLWQANYIGVPNMPGGTLRRSEPSGVAYPLDYNWGSGSPGGAPAGNWTARWLGRYHFDDGNYIFQAQGQDGIRVTLDGTVVINKWSDGYSDLRNRFIGVGAGDHTVTVDYYDRLGNAAVRVWWYRDTAPGLPQ